jgi:hypothetical protein
MLQSSVVTGMAGAETGIHEARVKRDNVGVDLMSFYSSDRGRTYSCGLQSIIHEERDLNQMVTSGGDVTMILANKRPSKAVLMPTLCASTTASSACGHGSSHTSQSAYGKYWTYTSSSVHDGG